uniref:Helicase n=1 Tax=viral metagenome TaxID=1070528 RepID=A0A6C0AGD0_9ZZZZ|tara:strand:- start:26692 stop:27864 length:1173 start_codon:yes stop_codon:yes gene_type:complete
MSSNLEVASYEVDKFEQMNLKRNVLRGIFSYGYEYPSAIQKKAIPAFISGEDLIAQAQSGTGKTAAFSVSILQCLDEEDESLQSIIVSPTRELTEQIYNVIKHLAQYTKIKFALLLGGQSRREQIEILRNGVQCVICTPGRINDLIESGYLITSNIKNLVLDEADELLKDAFVSQIRFIVENIPSSTQICLFSATMSDSCLKTAHKFLNEPNTIYVRKEQLTLEGINQYYVFTDNDKIKYDTIIDLYSSIIINQLIIYCNTKQRVVYLANSLTKDNYTCACIHSDLTTSERMHIMRGFRNGEVRVLISTDLLSRGIDVQQVSLVINYDLPRNVESYIHRIGRSGRYGRRGLALNFISNYDKNLINELENFYNTQISELPMNIEAVFSSAT